MVMYDGTSGKGSVKISFHTSVVITGTQQIRVNTIFNTYIATCMYYIHT